MITIFDCKCDNISACLCMDFGGFFCKLETMIEGAKKIEYVRGDYRETFAAFLSWINSNYEQILSRVGL